ncbi:related to emopamil-binding protein [Phialocephala subalpina]|uniref:Related to emopamil-binding protein n=1 Tax=Phialocephala subalpina TaxID=576137 RepID=A0A1L7XBW4_9HELO|nr:related to emopamil-binding protein [Phialocephala subalpina]
MALHPYYPQGVSLSSAIFVENDLPVATLISAFAAGLTVILGSVLFIARSVNPKLGMTDIGLILWFTMSGTIHLFFESFFVFNNSRIAGMQTLFAQLWKEYALSDSRYMFSDPLVLCMETWTVIIWGPLCFLTAVFITTSSPFRHPVQALVSTGHLYGNLIYLSTSLYEDFYIGKKYYRPEPYYFWVYFVLMNLPWLVVPAFCLYSCFKESAKAFALFSKQETGDGPSSKKLL